MENNINSKGTVPIEELLKRIHVLEETHARLRQKILKLVISGHQQNSDCQTSNSVSSCRAHQRTVDGTAAASSSFLHCLPFRGGICRVGVDHTNDDNGNGLLTCGRAARDGGGVTCHSAVKLTEAQHSNILHSIDQPVHIIDLKGCIIFRNPTWEKFYGYTAAETLGKAIIKLVIEPGDAPIVNIIVKEMAKGDNWTGEFLVRNKRGERFVVFGTNKPLRDENGTVTGIICVSAASRPYEEMRPGPSVSAPTRVASGKLGLDPQQPPQTASASKISGLATKVKSKIRKRHSFMDHEGGSGDDHYSEYRLKDVTTFDHEDADALSGRANILRGDIVQSPFGVFSSMGLEERFTRKSMSDSGYVNENGPGIHNVFSSKAEWTGKNGIVWPWKRNEGEGGCFDARTGRFCWHWLYDDQENENGLKLTSSASAKVESQLWGNTNCAGNNNKDLEPCSSLFNKMEVDNYSMNCQIMWKDLVIKERIGRGSCGTVYHAVWDGSDVALKLFFKQEYSNELVLSFTQEVSLMKRLRHPNILLFMGAVTSPQRLCIVTEFLRRGSLFQLLKRNTDRLDWRHRVRMAMDIARGMNYLHHCHPPIIHRDLKSSNLLVDKDWTVKIGDFGLCGIKHENYLTTNAGKGSPEWMAPEVLRNKQADEKSDVYSYGVVLWEIATEKTPWDGLDAMQVVEAVGFMNQRLDIPKDVDPRWASLIERCLCSDPQSRLTFQEILDKLKDLSKKFAVQVQASHAATT